MADEEKKEIEKFDPSKMMDGVKDRIKATFVSLIPDDAWEGMIKGVQDSFFEKKKVNTGTSYDPKWVEKPSEFEELALSLMREKAKETIMAFLNSPEVNGMTVWDDKSQDYRYDLGDRMKELVVKHMPEIMSKMMELQIGNAFNQFKHFYQNNQMMH